MMARKAMAATTHVSAESEGLYRPEERTISVGGQVDMTKTMRTRVTASREDELCGRHHETSGGTFCPIASCCGDNNNA